MKKTRKLFKDIAQYQKNKKSVWEMMKERYSFEDGSALIKLDLKHTEIYNPMSMDGQKELNSEIYSYIDERVYPIPAEIPVTIQLFGVDKTEQKHVKQIVSEHYDLQLQDKKLDLKINAIRYITLFVVGALLLALYFVLANTQISQVWYEVFSIIATFIVWEGADYAILVRHDLRIAYRDAAQTALAKIEFADEENR